MKKFLSILFGLLLFYGVSFSQNPFEWDSNGNIKTPYGFTKKSSITNLTVNGPWIDITDPIFGAKGNGVTDNTIAIQAAINAAEGKKLYIPDGTFITSPLTGVNNIEIEFAPNAILKAKANLADNSILLGFSSKHNVILRNPHFDGNKDNQIDDVYGISFGNDSYNCKIIGGEIHEFNYPAICLSGYDHLIDGVIIHDCDMNAIQAVATDTYDTYQITLKNCTIYNIGTYGGGIEFDEGVHDSLIDGNIISDCGEGGIQVENGCYNVTVVNNNIFYTTTLLTSNDYGIIVGYDSTLRTPTITTKNIIISNNRARNCYVGFFINTATLLTITGNEAHFCESDGFRISSVDYSVFALNRAINNGKVVANRFGFLFSEVNYSTIIGNLAYDSRSGVLRTQAYGIYESTSSDYNTMVGNISNNNITINFYKTGANTKTCRNIEYSD